MIIRHTRTHTYARTNKHTYTCINSMCLV